MPSCIVWLAIGAVAQVATWYAYDRLRRVRDRERAGFLVEIDRLLTKRGPR